LDIASHYLGPLTPAFMALVFVSIYACGLINMAAMTRLAFSMSRDNILPFSKASNDQNLWMASVRWRESGAHLPGDDLNVIGLIKSRRWRAGSGRYALAHGSSGCGITQRERRWWPSVVVG
jgi:hypothetical protein